MVFPRRPRSLRNRGVVESWSRQSRGTATLLVGGRGQDRSTMPENPNPRNADCNPQLQVCVSSIRVEVRGCGGNDKNSEPAERKRDNRERLVCCVHEAMLRRDILDPAFVGSGRVNMAEQCGPAVKLAGWQQTAGVSRAPKGDSESCSRSRPVRLVSGRLGD